MTSPPMTSAPLRPITIVLFWLPLAATWFMMALEGPYIAAIVARMPSATQSLAAFGVATALAWLIESPIMMLLSASTALVRDRASYIALRQFATGLNGVVTLGMTILSIPAVFRFVGETMIGLPADISRLAHTATTILILWPAAIGYRRFYQGILVRHHLTRRVAYGTVVRLVTMSVTAAILAFTIRPPGAVIGAIALLAGVVAEAVASRWMARHIVRSLMTSDENAPGTLLGVWKIARFYFPLALTSMLSMALGPLVTFGLGRGRAPLESLAVWPVVNAMAFVFRSGGVAFQEVAIALGGSGGEHSAEVRRTAAWLGAFASLALGLVAFTPLATVWFQDFSGLPPRLAEFALWPIRVLTIYPALEFLLSVQRARWITGHRTGTITVATALEAFALAASLLLLVGPLDMVGVTAGAIAMLLGRMAANAYLFLRASEQKVEISGV